VTITTNRLSLILLAFVYSLLGHVQNARAAKIVIDDFSAAQTSPGVVDDPGILGGECDLASLHD